LTPLYPRFYGIDYGIFIAEKLAERLPLAGFDCIVGIPRSGLIFANIIASKRGLPLSTPDDFIRGIVWQSRTKPKPNVYKKILLVDEAVGTGRKMEEAIEVLKTFDPNLSISTASLFRPFYKAQKVDHYQVALKGFSAFEWTLDQPPFTKDYLGGLCVDLDGVLCMNDNPEEPYIIPNYTLKAIITSRPESDRKKTEDWLRKYGFKYEKLIMCTDPSFSTLSHKVKRLLSDPSFSSVDHKVKHLKELQPYWYWESNIAEAKQIALKANLPVLCFEDMNIYGKGARVRPTV